MGNVENTVSVVCHIPVLITSILSPHLPLQRLPPLLFSHLQVNQVLEVGDRSQGTNKYTAMSKWMQQLQTSHATVLNKLV